MTSVSHLSILASMRKRSEQQFFNTYPKLSKFRVSWVSWPPDQPQRFNGCNIPCDAWTGPCCCGAWHTEGK